MCENTRMATQVAKNKRMNAVENKLKLLALLCEGSLLLSACGGGESASKAEGQTQEQSQSEDDSSEDSGSADEKQTEAYNEYVAAHNNIVGMFYGSTQGIDNLLTAYKKQNLSSGTPKDPIMYLNTSMLRNMLGNLDTATKIKVGGDYAALEAAAAKVLATGTQLKQQADSLEAYFKSKKFMDDGYAKSKAENAAFEKQWEQFNADYEVFNTELSKVEKVQRLASIESFTKAGKLREAAQEKALMSANEVLETLSSVEDLNNAEKMATADAEMQKLEAALTELNDANGKTKDSDSYKFEGTFDYLTSFTGYWREMKAEKDPSRYERMVDSYNSAVR